MTRRWHRSVGATALAIGTVVGPAGCADFFDLDPPNRVSYAGAYEAEVGWCGKATFTSNYGVNVVADEIEVDDSGYPELVITGRTTHFFADDPDVVTTWKCIGDAGIMGSLRIVESKPASER
ncbi:hypothetical protein [Herbiconiux sp. UC225_62]|uniref:hypothetical protein n=1 Tax=Herbiconiux sp. UC225_62 TaxID=3350168 RepID=UPI0036D2A397